MNCFLKKNFFNFVILNILFLFFAGCAPVPEHFDDELKNFLADIKNKKNQENLLQQAMFNESIKKLSAQKKDNDLLVSLEVKDTPLFIVIERLFSVAAVPNFYNKESLNGRVTASFDNLPLTDAIRVILSGTNYIISVENGIYIIKSSHEDKNSVKTKEDMIIHEVFCQNSEVTNVINALKNLCPANSQVKYSVVPNSNSILLSGKTDEVKALEEIIKKADRKPVHILIEATVVEVDSFAFWELGMDISSAATGEFNNITTSFGNLNANNLTFSWINKVNPSELSAAINYLVSKNKANIITRPYLATISGEKASINITNDRYVIVNSGTGEFATSTTLPVTSGALLDITPKIISENSILMTLDVEDSGFNDPPVNIAVEVDKNKASTTMQIENGSTIVIGGLMKDHQHRTKSGFPFLSDIPVVNSLFAKENATNDKGEVMIFITPYIWQPDVSMPLHLFKEKLIN